MFLMKGEKARIVEGWPRIRLWFAVQSPKGN
jgi:hypothetical protein